MTASRQYLHREVDGEHYFLGYYGDENGMMKGLLALDSWRTHQCLNFAREDMDAMANMIDEPVTPTRFQFPIDTSG